MNVLVYERRCSISVQDLIFKVVSTGETVYDPVTLVSATTTILSVTNLGAEDLTGLGMYIVTATKVGDVDNPADFPPETDYQDVMTWGQSVLAGLTVTGGMKLTLPQTTGPNVISYIAREQGSKRSNKLAFKDLVSGAVAEFTVHLETPAAVGARRMYIDLVLD